MMRVSYKYLFQALKETVGHRGMNVYINAIDQPIALGYYHDDNHVRLLVFCASLYLNYSFPATLAI